MSRQRGVSHSPEELINLHFDQQFRILSLGEQTQRQRKLSTMAGSSIIRVRILTKLKPKFSSYQVLCCQLMTYLLILTTKSTITILHTKK